MKLLKNPNVNIGGKVNPYIRRWFLTPWSSDDSSLKKYRLPNKYLHNIRRPDDDRALHTHPWFNLSIVIWGGYWEHRFLCTPIEGFALPKTERIWRGAGSIIFRKAKTAHRLELELDPKSPNGYRHVWTIFVTWRKSKEWGFWCEEKLKAKLVHWKIFTSSNGLEIGKGCGE